MPVINFKNGTQLGQTQSMIRWIAQTQAGKKGERLYPGKLNPETCYQIDQLTEISDGYLSKGWGVYMDGPVDDEKAKEIVSTTWRELLRITEKTLRKNPNPNFLIGNNMTTADCCLGAYFLKFVIASQGHFPHRDLYAAELEKFPKTKYWAQNTIKK